MSQNSSGSGKFKIISCSDCLLWYSNHIGHTFTPIKEIDGDCYLTREKSGYLNIVYKKDCEEIYD